MAKKSIQLSLVDFEPESAAIHFQTNMGYDISILSYIDGRAHMYFPINITLDKIAEIVESCFLPGSSFTKKTASMFEEFKEIKFYFNNICILVDKTNFRAEDILNQYFSKRKN